MNNRMSHLCNFGLSPRVAAMVNGPEEKGKISFRAEKDRNEAELLIYEFIGYDWWNESGMTAARFYEDLKALGDLDKLTIRINSPGGDIFDGFSIYNLIAGLEYQVDVIVDGIAASAASVIAMAGDDLKMHATSTLMIHDAWCGCMGNEQDMREVADVLGKLDGQIAAVYAGKSGGNIADFRNMMDSDTYLTADDAVDINLADGVIETLKQAKASTRRSNNASVMLADLRQRKARVS